MKSHGSCLSVSNSASSRHDNESYYMEIFWMRSQNLSSEDEHKLCECKEGEADLCVNSSRTHLSSFYLHDKLKWKIKHGKHPVVILCTLTAVSCRFYVCCCTAQTGKLTEIGTKVEVELKCYFAFWAFYPHLLYFVLLWVKDESTRTCSLKV